MRRVGWALLILAICFAAGTVLWGAATERSTSLVCGEIKSKVCEQQTDPMLGFVLAALIAILGLVVLSATKWRAGKPTRAAIGASVEVIMTLLFSGSEVRAPLARDRFLK
jgi:hypothetical protein